MTASTQANALADATGWQAQLSLTFEARPHKTVLAHRTQRGPLAVQRPFYPEGPVCHVYMLHPPGGVVGGDILQINTQVAEKAHALLTTPGATKFYRSAGELAEQHQQLSVEEHATLEWMPQETIYFPGAKAQMTSHFDLAESGKLIAWETHCFGLPANQETFSEGEVTIDFALTQNDVPLLLEKLHITPATLQRPTGLRGASVMSTFIATPANEAVLTLTREVLANEPHLFSATLIEHCLLVRYIGESTAESRRVLTDVWMKVRAHVLGCEPSPPRIWLT